MLQERHVEAAPSSGIARAPNPAPSHASSLLSRVKAVLASCFGRLTPYATEHVNPVLQHETQTTPAPGVKSEADPAELPDSDDDFAQIEPSVQPNSTSADETPDRTTLDSTREPVESTAASTTASATVDFSAPQPDGSSSLANEPQHPAPEESPRTTPEIARSDDDPQITDFVLVPAPPRDVVLMKQLSVGGMAGPLSRGVCNAATTDWFRRIEDGLPTWKHVPGDSPGDPPREVENVDWYSMRSRLQRIQKDGPGGDPLFNGRQYERGEAVHQAMQGTSRKSRADASVEMAKAVINHARGKFERSAELTNTFFQLDISLGGHVYGREGHTIGVHIARPQPGAECNVHVFDANAREAVIPEAQFSQWLTEHMESRYGKRLTHAVLASEIQCKTIK